MAEARRKAFEPFFQTAVCCRWTAEAGHSVRLLAPHTLQEELKLDVAAMRSSPVSGCQFSIHVSVRLAVCVV
jgi:hypothetical protein